MIETLSLADVDGTLCVVSATNDYENPVVISQHWPTRYRTIDFIRHYEVTAEQLATHFLVKRSMPGEYWLEPKDAKSWQKGFYISLIDGGRTLSVKTDKAPLPKPKTKVRCEYESGQWWKYLASGRKPA